MYLRLTDEPGKEKERRRKLEELEKHALSPLTLTHNSSLDDSYKSVVNWKKCMYMYIKLILMGNNMSQVNVLTICVRKADRVSLKGR